MIKTYETRVIEEIKRALVELEAKDKNGRITTHDAVRLMKAEVTQALERGYSLKEVFEIIALKGLDISMHTFRLYLNEAKHNQKKRTYKSAAKRAITQSKPEERKAAGSLLSPEHLHAGFREDY